MEVKTEVLNEILFELKNLRSLNENVKKLEKKIDSLKYSSKDIEILNLILEMEKKNLWANESDLKKSGIEV